MKSKIIVFLFVIVACLGLFLPVFAVEATVWDYQPSRLIDTCKLLTESEHETLLSKLDEISERRKLDIVIITVSSLDGYDLIRDYADDLYDRFEFGYGEEKDGILLLISMEEENREWWISSSGYGIYAFTDAGIDYIGDKIVSDLSYGDYAAAFDTFADLCDDFITHARTDRPYDGDLLPAEPLSLMWIPFSIIVGVIIANIVVACMKGNLKTVRSRTTADSYVRDGSMNVTESRDIFLYHTVTKTPKPKPQNGGSSGSRVHTSSSGRVHGGRGGKF